MLFQAGSNESPSWSPDGRYIAFFNRNGREKFYIMYAGGSGEKAIIWKKVMIQTLVGHRILTIARNHFKVEG